MAKKPITAPRPQLIIDYKLCFGVKPPDNRISLLKNISKNFLLFEIVALNYRLKPKHTIQIDTSLETQIKELKYFTQSDELFSRYASIAQEFAYGANDYPNFFNRQACLFAIEELINSDEIQEINDYKISSVEQWGRLVEVKVNVKIHHLYGIR